MSVFIPKHKPIPMPSVDMPLLPTPRCYDVEIYYNDGTKQKYFDVEWNDVNDEYIILTKGESKWYIFKRAIKYIKRIRVEDKE